MSRHLGVFDVLYDMLVGEEWNDEAAIRPLATCTLYLFHASYLRGYDFPKDIVPCHESSYSLPAVILRRFVGSSPTSMCEADRFLLSIHEETWEGDER